MKKLSKIVIAGMLCGSLTATTPLLAQNETNAATNQRVDRDNDDDTGKWGLLGLVGLLGLLGMRKKDYDTNRTRTTARNP